jgi:hypothetical protein
LSVHPLSPRDKIPGKYVAQVFLVPAVDAQNNAIPLPDKDVLMLTVPPNQRDTYRIGASIDLIRVWNKLTAPPAR